MEFLGIIAIVVIMVGITICIINVANDKSPTKDDRCRGGHDF